jgi:hypothetical protein
VIPRSKSYKECRPCAQGAYDNVAEVGRGAIRGNVERLRKGECELMANRICQNHTFN